MTQSTARVGRFGRPASAQREDSAPWRQILFRPVVLLVVLYAIAICFERFVEVEVFKPYRLIGGLLILVAFVRGRLVLDGIARAILLFVSVGAALAVLRIILVAAPADDLMVASLLWLFNIATYVAVCSLLGGRREIIVVLIAHTVAMVFASYDILSHASALGEEASGTRISGDFRNPAHACLSMLVATLVLITLMRVWLSRMRGLFVRLSLILLVLTAIVFELYVTTLTGSRAGAALFLAGVLVYLFVVGRRHFAVAAAVFGIGLVALVSQLDAWPGFPQANVLARRLETKGVDTARLYLWRAGVDACLDTYGAGVGLAQYRDLHQHYFARYAFASDPRWADARLTLHSDYVSAFVEFGVLGFVVFVALARRIWRAAAGIQDRGTRALALALVVSAGVNAALHTVLPYFGLWFYLALISLWCRFETRDLPSRKRPA